MFELTDALMGFINGYLFTGFGTFTFLWVLAALFRKNDKVLDGIDRMGCRIIAIAGLAFTGIWLVWFLATYYGGGPEAEGLKRRLFGPYGYSLWIHTVVYFVATQLLWFDRVHRQKPVRAIIAFLLMFSFEKYVIVVTSFHRDYAPDGWSGSGYEMLFYGFLGVAISGIVFTAIAGLFYLVPQKFKWRQNR